LEFKIGDLITRNSYKNDVVFKITKIDNNIAEIKGIEFRLIADSPLNDLRPYIKEENKILKKDKKVV
jgi:spore coat assemly protein